MQTAEAIKKNSGAPTARTVNFNNLPEQVAELHDKIDRLLLMQSENKPAPPCNKIPVGIARACEITGLARPTIYSLAPKGEIPNFKKGGRLYFYEDELLAWIESGKRMSAGVVDAEADANLINRKRIRKPMVSSTTALQ